MKHKLLILFLLFSNSIIAQYTSIPDIQFERFLINFGYDTGIPDGKVLTSNINTVTKLDFVTGGQNFISSLKGIEDFTALTELTIIDGSLLTSLDVSKNTALTKLICSSNRLTSLDVSKNVALTELECGYNNISNLDITKNTLLKSLSAASNQLSALDLSKCPLLETVQIRKNSLTDINVSNATNLNFLSCGENQLTSLDITKNTLLSLLACGTNNLSTLDISKNINLKSFSCENNNLINLDFTSNIKLEYFACSNNKFVNLDFTYNLLLYEISCANNQLTNINISKNIKLYRLFCNYNNLTNLDTSKNTKLNYLNCEYNQITSLDVSKNDNLGLLRCNNNQLIVLDLRSPASFTWWNDYNSWLNNPNLKCINVPNAYFFGYFWNGRKDATASFIDDVPPKFESSNQTICSKQNPIISDITVDGYGIKWFNSESTLIELPLNTPLVEGKTYYAMNTAGSCEGPRSSVTINLKATSIPTAISLQNLCNIANPTLANLEITGNNIKWYNSLLGGNSIPVTTSLMNGISYYASQSSNGCESERVPVFVNILNNIKPTTTSPQTFCIQENATLNSIAITGQNIKWYDTLITGNLLTNSTLLENGSTYYATQSINGCESDRVLVKVIVEDNQKPIPNLGTLPTITGDCNTTISTIPTATDTCAGTITATTASPLSYSLAGTYTIVWNYNDGNGNSTTQNQTVTISTQPLPTTTSPQTFCIQENATLNSIAITGRNIKWYDAITNGNLLNNSASLQNGITYYASQTINGCESERVAVVVNIQNTATPTANSPQTFCASQNPTLNSILITGTAIKWYDNSSAGNLLANTTTLQDGQTYYASQTLNGCESTTRIPVSISLISTLPVTNYEEQFCDDLNDGTETIDLSSYNSSIISNTSDYTFTYYESLSAAENEIGSSKITNFSTYKLTLGENKIYVRVNSNTPCYAVAELKLTLLSKPKITIEDIVPICENNSINIDAGAGFDHYLWSNGATTQKITVANPGVFSVTVTNDFSSISCSSTKNFTVKNSNKASITSIETKDWTDNNNEISVIATGDGEYEYSIDGYNYQSSKQFSGLTSGKYTIYVRDKNGCGTAKDEVYLLMYPKFFTPNGDGYNDTWKIKFSEYEEGLIVQLFDRYGKLIKVLDNYSAGWNGTFNGNLLPADDYWFIVTRANGQEYKGHFSLKR